jgi:hypothetical protein
MAFQLKTAAFPPNGRIPDIYTTAQPPPQHNQLVSERRVLCLKSTL